MADEVSKSGIWIDSKTGKVVESQPEEGFQVVPKGGVIGAAEQAQLDLLAELGKPAKVPADQSVQEPAQKPPVTTATVNPKRS